MVCKSSSPDPVFLFNLTISSWPWLPVELIERIIWKRGCYHSLLTIELLSSTPLVQLTKLGGQPLSKSVREMCTSVTQVTLNKSLAFSATHIHSTLRGETSINLCCRSLTFIVDIYPSPTSPIYGELLPPFHERSFQKWVMCSVPLSFIDRPLLLPNLRRLFIQYIDCGFEDLHDS
jgi:hypothetical protein